MLSIPRAQLTLASNFSHTDLRIESYAPSFLKLWARDSIAALVAEGKGRSDALNLRGAVATTGSPTGAAPSVPVVAMISCLPLVEVEFEKYASQGYAPDAGAKTLAEGQDMSRVRNVENKLESETIRPIS